MNYNCAYTRKLWVYKNTDFIKLSSIIPNSKWANIINGAETLENVTENFTSEFLSSVRQGIP